MGINERKCDDCGKRTDDWTKERGWLHMTAGRGAGLFVFVSDGVPRATLADLPRTPHVHSVGPMDFCGVECFKSSVAKALAETEEPVKTS